MAMDARAMTVLHTEHGLLAGLMATGGAFAAGMLVGGTHHAALWWSVRRLAASSACAQSKGIPSSPARTRRVFVPTARGLSTQHAAALEVAVMALGRFTLVAIALLSLAQLGALPLVAALAGMLASRCVALQQLATPS
jgi:hypothetical protein